MPLFTVEVVGRPVLVFSGKDHRAAEDILGSSIGPALQDFEEEGDPVWDGEGELSVREASLEEVARWEEGLSEAKQSDGSGEQDPAGYAVFLIEVEAGTEGD